MKKRILFGITGLTLGGAERVLVDIVNELVNEYDITIFTLYGKGEFQKELDEKIKIISLFENPYDEFSNIKKKIIIPLKVLFQKNRIYKKYIQGKADVEISFLEGPITRIFSVRKDNIKKIAWIHNDIGKVFGEGIKAKIKMYIDKKIYSRYDKLVFVSNDNKNKFQEKYNNMKINKTVIYNYINRNKVLEKANEEQLEKFDRQEINFVTVCRLVEQKALERLIEIHAKLIEEGMHHKIYVVGDGPLREKITNKISDEKVQDTFILLGKKKNPYPYIKNADEFILLSYFEGYPMVVEEAKILNKDIMITNTAAREVVKNYRKVRITENNEKEIEKSIKNEIKRLSAKKEEKAEKIEEYNNENIINQIIEIIEK